MAQTIPADGGAPSAPSYNFNLLMNAIVSRSPESVQQLISEEPALAKACGWHRQTALHRACMSGMLKTVTILLDAQADVNARNNFNETPLHYACKVGMPHIVHTMLEQGADPFLVDNMGKGVLHHAAESGIVPLLHLLCTQYPELDPTCQDNNQQTPLHLAIKAAKLDAFHYLMKKGRSNLKAADKDGNWPIHISAQEGYGHMTWSQLCVLGRPALNVSNKHGYTPYQLANMYDTPRHKELVKELVWLKQFPEDSKIELPGRIMWYFNLLLPFVSFGMAILLTRFMSAYHGLVFLPVVGGLVCYIRSNGHRLNHVSRYPNPIFAGAFSAGILHTILVTLVVIRPYMQEHPIFVLASYSFAALLLFLGVKLIRVDPGVATQSAQDQTTGKILTVVDVGRDENLWTEICGDCEIVRGKYTKHCKLCNKCMSGLDHHCLFLLKCVAQRNHTLFVWFLMVCFICMLLFLCSVYIYLHQVYPGLTFTGTVSQMFATDAWVLCLIILNALSAFWVGNLVRYQCNVVKNGYTVYFQPSFQGDVLTDYEKCLNIIRFLTNRRPHIVNPCMNI